MLKLTGFILLLMSAHFITYQNKRSLLLFADKTNNKLIKQQQSILAKDPAGLKERDLEIHTYYADQNPEIFHSKNIKPGFTIILVGKDGGEKLRSHQPILL